MAKVSSKSNHIRSVSLPNRTHPTTQIVEFELENIKSLEKISSSSTTYITAGSICYGLTGLQELYKSIDGLLNMPSTIDALFHQQNREQVDELLDISIRILDVCSRAKDIVTECKENVRDLQSSLRRRQMNSTSINKYFTSRKQMKKDAKRSLLCLKQIDQQINALDLGEDHHVIRFLQEVNSTSISIFQSVLKFLSVKTYKQKMKKWTIVARLMIVQKGKIETESSNELENADVGLCCLCDNIEGEGLLKIVQNRVQILEGSLEGLENQLDSMFRCLIKSRTTILNVLSC